MSLYTFNIKRLPFISCLAAFSLLFPRSMVYSQTTLGVTGLLNSPSATMSPEGTVKIGGNFLNTNMTPETWTYNTFNYFVNITFLPFFEASLTNTAFDLKYEGRFNNVDRSVSLRFRLLKEKNFFPAIVIGSNDLLTSNTTNYFSSSGGNKYFGTHYVAISKHLDIPLGTIGLHAAYNILSSNKFQLDVPISGGISFAPVFFENLNLIAEYDTKDFNLGGNVLLFQHLFFQAFIQDLKYLSFGFHAQIPLL